MKCMCVWCIWRVYVAWCIYVRVQLDTFHALADPTLELHDGNGMLLASNDNWKDTQEAEIEADLLAPTSDLESAIAATLAPGAYTAIVRGNNGTTGVALVEAYQLDN